jgi:hypothetical protein
MLELWATLKVIEWVVGLLFFVGFFGFVLWNNRK